jgi:putative PIN family toxin of toxin-antitoxin system
VILRAVVDPNVFISAQISSLGHPARIAQVVDKGIFELVVSERLLSELHDVLMRPRFRRHMTEREVENLVEDLREKGIITEEGEIRRMVPDDPKDDYLVTLARVSGAGYLVSGDPHLTAASLDAATVAVLTPRRFSEMLEESDR